MNLTSLIRQHEWFDTVAQIVKYLTERWLQIGSEIWLDLPQSIDWSEAS